VESALNQMGVWRNRVTGVWICTIDKHLLHRHGEVPEDIVSQFLHADWSQMIPSDGDVWAVGSAFLMRVNSNIVIMVNMAGREYVQYASTSLVNRLPALSDFFELTSEEVLRGAESLLPEAELPGYYRKLVGSLSVELKNVKAFFVMDRGAGVVYDYFSRGDTLKLVEHVETQIAEEEVIFYRETDKVTKSITVGGLPLYYHLSERRRLVVCLVTTPNHNPGQCLSAFAEEVLSLYEKGGVNPPTLDSPTAVRFVEVFLRHVDVRPRKSLPPGVLKETLTKEGVYHPLKMVFTNSITRRTLFKKIRKRFTELSEAQLREVLEGKTTVIEAIRENTALWGAYIELYGYLESRRIVE